MVKVKPVYASLGSVSSGTMRTEDLIGAFMSALSELTEELRAPGSTDEPPEALAERVKRVGDLDTLMGRIEVAMVAEDGDYFESEEADWDLEELFDAMDTFAPPHASFGAHEGDGADYGFWVQWDSITEGIEDGTIIRIVAHHCDDPTDYWPSDELAERKEAGITSFVLIASPFDPRNDAGDTLYDADGSLIWSV